MEMYDNFCTIIGIIAVVIGIYELFTKTLVGRDRDKDKITKEAAAKFLPYDVATYIITGVLMTLLGLNAKIPFMQSGAATAIAIALSLTIIVLNVYLSNKILGTRK